MFVSITGAHAESNYVVKRTFADGKTCKHAVIPPIRHETTTDDFNNVDRKKVIKGGWIPDYSEKTIDREALFFDARAPEAECGAPGCYYHYRDKRGNGLMLYIGDLVAEIEVECKS